MRGTASHDGRGCVGGHLAAQQRSMFIPKLACAMPATGALIEYSGLHDRALSERSNSNEPAPSCRVKRQKQLQKDLLEAFEDSGVVLAAEKRDRFQAISDASRSWRRSSAITSARTDRGHFALQGVRRLAAVVHGLACLAMSTATSCSASN